MAQKTVTDVYAVSFLEDVRKGYRLSAEKQRQAFSLLNGQEWSSTDSTLTFVYNTMSEQNIQVIITKNEFAKWQNAQEESSATDLSKVKKQQQEKIAVVYEQLKARRLDEGDACAITDPTDVISPCGCHYSNNDTTYLMTTGYCADINAAYAVLAENEKYKTLSNEVLKRIDKGDIDLSKEALYQRYGIKEEDIVARIQEGADLNTYYKNPTPEQQAAAAQQNTTGEPRDCYNVNPTTISSGVTVFPESDFVQWLLENINERFRKDSKKPMIPTSIGASIAMVRGTNSSANFGKYNYWKFPYDKSLTSLDQDSEWCAFSSPGDGIQAILTALHSEKYNKAVSMLKEKMWDSTDDDKDSATRSILIILSGDYAEEHAKKALEYVKKYNMREWDTNKTEAEGGHADTKANSSAGAKKTEEAMSKAVKRITEASGQKGVGVIVEPVGSDHSRIIKLPKGKTPCEPVYPDLVTVGDHVPEWVMSETYAQLYKEAEEKALKAAGIAVQSQDEIELEYVNKKISAFQEQQFAAWCQQQGISYTNEDEKAEAKKKYSETAAADPENFTDGIWTPDEATKDVYLGLLRDKATIAFNGDTATTSAHLKYVEGIKTAAAEIQAREGNWNQDPGHQLSAAELGYAGGTDFSAINNTGTPGTKPSGSSSAGVEAMVAWAVATANDQSHGYSQENRTGPDYDCSSFVYYALKAGGFDAIGKRGYAGTCDTLWEDLQALGDWKKYDYSAISKSIQRGDILHRKSGHVAIAVDSTTQAAAHTWRNGSQETGDQGTEISISSIGSNWDYVYRYQGTKTSGGGINISYTTVSAAGFKLMNGGGYGTYWIEQQPGRTSWAGAQAKTLNAMDVLGQWFYNKTGKPLVIAAVTNGDHEPGEHSHGTGWKFDCNDYGSGAEGTLTTDSYGKGTLTDEFLNFGTSIGLGMNWEQPGTENVHIDVSAWGDQWADFNGNTLPSVINHGGLRE